MLRHRYLAASLAAVLTSALALGCGSSTGSGDDDDDNPGDDTPGGPDAATPGNPDADPGGGEFVPLIEGEWSMPAGQEGYRCVFKTLTEDVWFDGIEAIAPEGTHHTVVTVGEPSQPDGVYQCGPGTNLSSMIYASGLGTDRFTFPAGVGVKLRAGQQIVANLHLFNFSNAPIRGVSGNRVRMVRPEDVEMEAESVLAGTFDIAIPAGAVDHKESGRCTMPNDTNIYAIIPHMHMLGTHMKVVAHSSEMGEVTALDTPFTFDNQKVNLMQPLIPMKAGDKIDIECTYTNTTGAPVNFGDSSLQEMCFAITFRYPANPNPNGVFCFL